MATSITIDWPHISIASIIAFLIGWYIFGLLGAIALAIIVMILMGIIKIKFK